MKIRCLSFLLIVPFFSSIDLSHRSVTLEEADDYRVEIDERIKEERDEKPSVHEENAKNRRKIGFIRLGALRTTRNILRRYARGNQNVNATTDQLRSLLKRTQKQLDRFDLSYTSWIEWLSDVIEAFEDEAIDLPSLPEESVWPPSHEDLSSRFLFSFFFGPRRRYHYRPWLFKPYRHPHRFYRRWHRRPGRRWWWWR